jgi:hypothetical protein
MNTIITSSAELIKNFENSDFKKLVLEKCYCLEKSEEEQNKLFLKYFKHYLSNDNCYKDNDGNVIIISNRTNEKFIVQIKLLNNENFDFYRLLKG